MGKEFRDLGALLFSSIMAKVEEDKGPSFSLIIRLATIIKRAEDIGRLKASLDPNNENDQIMLNVIIDNWLDNLAAMYKQLADNLGLSREQLKEALRMHNSIEEELVAMLLEVKEKGMVKKGMGLVLDAASSGGIVRFTNTPDAPKDTGDEESFNQAVKEMATHKTPGKG